MAVSARVRGGALCLSGKVSETIHLNSLQVRIQPEVQAGGMIQVACLSCRSESLVARPITVRMTYLGFLNTGLEEVENDQPTAGFEDPERGVDCDLRVFGVMNDASIPLAENREIEGLFIDRWGFDFADAVFLIGSQPVGQSVGMI